MKYVSIRQPAAHPNTRSFEEVLLAGLAPDAGLYVPVEWPRLSLDEIRAMRGLPYAEIAARVVTPFLGGAFAPQELKAIFTEIYGGSIIRRWHP